MQSQLQLKVALFVVDLNFRALARLNKLLENHSKTRLLTLSFPAMICPKCKHVDTRVVDSRDASEGRAIRRRRECPACKQRFTTFEKPETTNFLVIKKDGSRESYDREKAVRGIWRACEKRPVTDDQISKMMDKLEEVWSGRGKEVKAEIIGRDIMHALKQIDEVAYIRFASVYRQFKDVESFKKELQNLLDR